MIFMKHLMLILRTTLSSPELGWLQHRHMMLAHFCK